MKTPNRREAPPTSIRRSKRLIRRTKPLEVVSEHVSEFEGAVASFENRYNEWILARHQIVIAFGALREAQADLDHELRGVGLAILTVNRGRRKSEVYRKYFPEGYGKTLRLSPEESLAIAAGLLVAMNDETAPDILARREPLATARARLESATAARQAAVDAVGQGAAMLEEEKLAWRKALNKFYFALRTFFSDRRAYVEVLFRVDARRQAEAEEEEEEEEGEQEQEEEETPGETEPHRGVPAGGTEPAGTGSAPLALVAGGPAPAAPFAAPRARVTTQAASTEAIASMGAIPSTATAATATGTVATDPAVPESSVGESAA